LQGAGVVVPSGHPHTLSHLPVHLRCDRAGTHTIRQQGPSTGRRAK
jgi:hypothetical protein